MPAETKEHDQLDDQGVGDQPLVMVPDAHTVRRSVEKLPIESQLDIANQQNSALRATLLMLAKGLGHQERKYWDQYNRFHEAINSADDESEHQAYQRGVEIVSGNIQGYLRIIGNLAKSAAGEHAIGPRDGFPTLKDIEHHEQVHLCGFWVIRHKIDQWPGEWSNHLCLTVLDGQPAHRNGGKDPELFDEGEIETVVSSMPVDIDGMPTHWPDSFERNVPVE